MNLKRKLTTYTEFSKLLAFYILLFHSTQLRAVNNVTNNEGMVSTKRTLNIRGYLSGNMSKENIEIFVWNNDFSRSVKFNQNHIKQVCNIENGEFNAKIDNLYPTGYLGIYQGTHNGNPIPIMELFPYEIGDSIKIVVNGKTDSRFPLKYSDNGYPKFNYDLHFSGKGYMKYEMKHQLNLLQDSSYRSYYMIPENKTQPSWSYTKRIENSLDGLAEVAAKQLTYLNNFRSGITSQDVDRLKTDLITTASNSIYRELLASKLEEQNIEVQDSIITFIDKMPLINSYKEISDTLRHGSAYALDAMLCQAELSYKLKAGTADMVDFVSKNYSNFFAGKIIALYLFKNRVFLDETSKTHILDYLQSFRLSASYVCLINSVKRSNPGTDFYNFTLPNAENKMFNLETLKGKMVFVDFFYTGCGNCISYYKNTVSKAEGYFNGNTNVVFVSVSIDANKSKWLESVKSGLYTNNGVVNLYTGGNGSNHPLIKFLSITGYPHPVLVGKDGKIITSEYRELGQNDPSKLIRLIDKVLKM